MLTVRTGITCFVESKYNQANCVDLIVTTPNTDKINSYFLSYYMNSSFARDQVRKNQGGLAQVHYNVTEVKKMRVVTPSLEEQKKIAEILSAMREKISLLKSDLGNHKISKKD